MGTYVRRGSAASDSRGNLGERAAAGGRPKSNGARAEVDIIGEVVPRLWNQR